LLIGRHPRRWRINFVTGNKFYTKRAAECIFVAEHNPCDRDIMLHLAAAYLRLATEIELRHRQRIQEFPQGTRADGPPPMGAA
jgi:hypothetical protein